MVWLCDLAGYCARLILSVLPFRRWFQRGLGACYCISYSRHRRVQWTEAVRRKLPSWDAGFHPSHRNSCSRTGHEPLRTTSVLPSSQLMSMRSESEGIWALRGLERYHGSTSGCCPEADV